MNEEHLERYAWLVVKFGVDLHPGDDLYIRGERIHRELALRVGEAAYDLGARRVHYRFGDPLEVSQLIRRGAMEDLGRYHERNQAWYAEVERSRSPAVFLDGQELPETMPILARTEPDKHAAFTRAASAAVLAFHRNAVDRRLCPIAVAAGATPAWARKLFPELPENAATSRLWELICRFTYADQDDALERLTAHDRAIRRRKRALDELGIREIHLTGGGNDLRIGLSAKARWQSASMESLSGHRFYVNFPSYEIYTTPDRRLADGRLVASMPFYLRSGILVKDLVLLFRDGR
ncbi:MAG: aminopeptidase, partial [bacterium]|nr:aminopeptidase [bacterium]